MALVFLGGVFVNCGGDISFHFESPHEQYQSVARRWDTKRSFLSYFDVVGNVVLPRRAPESSWIMLGLRRRLGWTPARSMAATHETKILLLVTASHGCFIISLNILRVKCERWLSKLSEASSFIMSTHVCSFLMLNVNLFSRVNKDFETSMNLIKSY